MKQELKLNVPGLLAFSTIAANGAQTLGAAIGLKQNTEADILADRASLVTARDNYEEGKLQLNDLREVVHEKLAEGITYGTVFRDLLKPRFGAKYSNAYQAIGLQGSMGMPRSVAKLTPVLEAIRAFMQAHEDMQNEPLNLTPAYVTTLLGDINTANNAVVTKNTSVKALLKVRRTAETKLTQRLRGLANELAQLIEPTDVRWLSFGFNLPGAIETPDKVENLQVALIGPTAVAMRWDAAARADYYRVWKKVLGVDEQPVAVGTPADVDFTLEGLPPGATVEIYVSAVNPGGEGQLSQKVTVVTHP
jgi:hypothetical protein